ncbi:UNVERIFIED_CONTAM: hypothetical protein Sindi_3037800, partial [Sesamum indicum]
MLRFSPKKTEERIRGKDQQKGREGLGLSTSSGRGSGFMTPEGYGDLLSSVP